MSYKPWAKGKRSVCGRIAFFSFGSGSFGGIWFPAPQKSQSRWCVCVLATTQQQQQKLCSSLYVQFVFFVFFVGFLCLVVFSFCSIVFLNAARVSSKCWCYLNLLVCCLFACVFLSRSSLSSVQLVTLWVFLSLFRFINLYFGTVNQYWW